MDALAEAVAERKTKLLFEIDSDITRYNRHAQWSYLFVQAMSWSSLGTSAAAGLLGLIPSGVPKWVVGSLATISAALIAAIRQSGLQQRSYWRYRKVDLLKSLRRRLEFQLPIDPSVDNIAAIASEYSSIEIEMTKDWENVRSLTRKNTH
jgi:hypothetical protein